MSFHLNFHHVYIKAFASIVGKKEKEGPYGNYFDADVQDDYAGKKTFEEGEIYLAKTAIEMALKKGKMDIHEIPLVFGGDLSNQIAITSRVMKDLSSAAIGVYSACATLPLALGLASTYVENHAIQNGLVFTSSSKSVAERQFRYPNDYGIQKKDSSTVTITGSASFIVSSEPSPIQITSLTYGQVYDPHLDNLNDMGSPMAYAAYHTIQDHLASQKETVDDYDMIVTGDLSSVGTRVLKACFLEDGINLSNHMDAGNVIYHREKEKVYAGGSGPGCIATFVAGYVLKEMLKGTYKRVLVVATGALFSPTLSQQKNSIPVIAHAITLERKENQR